jgi:magnesium-transporting ATPase (P-type)
VTSYLEVAAFYITTRIKIFLYSIALIIHSFSISTLRLRQLTALGLLVSSLSGCATVFGGHITDYQRTKPMPGQPQREVRVGALIADILLVGLLGVGVDFATGAIYKPHPSGQPANASAPASDINSSSTVK